VLGVKDVAAVTLNEHFEFFIERGEPIRANRLAVSLQENVHAINPAIEFLERVFDGAPPKVPRSLCRVLNDVDDLGLGVFGQLGFFSSWSSGWSSR